MSASRQVYFPNQWPKVRQTLNPDRRLHEHIMRALNKIKKPSSAQEIAELLNRDLGPGDLPFQEKEVSAWLKDAGNKVLNLYWLESRPRR